MWGIHNYAGFIAAILGFQLVPGPGTLTILNATARSGIRSGMYTVFGTLAGDLVYMLGAVLGLAAVLTARPLLLSGLQWIGILYLMWLGVGLLRAPATGTETATARPPSGWDCFRQAFTVTLTNPKAIMFFMAFFPLFLAPDSPPVTLAIMMAHVTGLSLLYQAGLVLVGRAVAVRLARFPSAGLIARRTVGVGLIGFGLKLALQRG